MQDIFLPDVLSHLDIVLIHLPKKALSSGLRQGFGRKILLYRVSLLPRVS